MADKSTKKDGSRKAASGKPPKPYKDFPLGPANNGAWQKKIRGTLYYFGKWGRVVNGKMERIQPDGCWRNALELYNAQKDDLFAGRTPRAKTGGLTVMELCNRFLTSKLRRLESREISPRTFTSYREVTDRIVLEFGKSRLVDDLAGDDFQNLRAKLAKSWGPVRLGCEIVRIKTVFKFGLDNGLMERPVRYGSEFKKPDKSVLRRHRAKNGARMFSAEEIKKLLDIAAPQMRAMILLGLNAGFGNADVSSLPLPAVNLENGWIRFPRPKTGIERRCPLWKETVDALKVAIAERIIPNDKADSDILFVTKYGNRWVRLVLKEITAQGPKHTPIDSVSLEFKKLLKLLEMQRPGLGFYALRHTFRTIADATKDFPAVRLVMGHADGSIDDTYREHIDDSRLVAVADHVRSWLYPPSPDGSKT